MKTFISSLFIFFVMLLLIRENGDYLAKTADDLREILYGVPQYSDIRSSDTEKESRDRLLRLKALWHEERERVSRTVSVRITEGIDDCLDRMLGALDHGEGAEFDISRAHLLRILDDLHRYEGIAIGALV